MDKKKVLILSDSEDEYLSSIFLSLKNSYQDSFETTFLNIFENQTNKKIAKLKKHISNPQLGKTDTFYDKFKDIGGPRFMKFINHVFYADKIKYVINVIKEHSPDIVLASNYFFVSAAISYKKKFNMACRVFAYNEELINHKWWDNKNNIYIVNNEIAFFDAIGYKRFSPALVKQISQNVPKSVKISSKTYEECRNLLGVQENDFCVYIDEFQVSTYEIIKQLLQVKEKLCIILKVKNDNEKDKIFKTIKNLNKNKLKFIFILLEEEPLGIKAADIFITPNSYAKIKTSLYSGTPILIYSKTSKKDANKRFFVNFCGVGTQIYVPVKIKKQIEEWIKNPEEVTYFKSKISKLFSSASEETDIAKIIYEESIKPSIKIDKNDYNNLLYELASQEKYDTFTTPINTISAKEILSYEQIKKSNIFSKIYSRIVKRGLRIFAPIINFFGFKIKIVGRENLKGIDKAISFSNHVHYLDFLWNYQTLSKKKFYVTGAPFNFKKGFTGSLFKAAGFVPIPASIGQQREFEKYVSEILSKNSFVHFYPEQAMWLRYEQSRPLKRGAFFYASKNNVPVIPIIFCFKKQKLRRRKTVVVNVCKPIYPNINLSQSENCKMMNEAAQKVYDDTIIDFYHYNREKYAMNVVQKTINTAK